METSAPHKGMELLSPCRQNHPVSIQEQLFTACDFYFHTLKGKFKVEFTEIILDIRNKLLGELSCFTNTPDSHTLAFERSHPVAV